MRALITIAIVLLSSIGFSQTSYSVPQEQVQIKDNPKKKEIKLVTPQKSITSSYETLEVLTLEGKTIFAYYGTESTIAVGDGWVSLSSRNGEVYYWFQY